MISRLFRPSGGLVYHWRAWRHRRSWAPFINELKAWLEAWKKDGDQLLLIGPSAGYTLPTSWLKRFNRVVAFDFDPLVPTLFRRKHPGVAVSFRQIDVFFKNGQLTLSPLKEILQEYPQAAVLFVNVLGQLLLECPVKERDWANFLIALRGLLDGHEWASFHDLYSLHRTGERIDHLTTGAWTHGLNKCEFRWQLTPNDLHFVEGAYARSAGKRSPDQQPNN